MKDIVSKWLHGNLLKLVVLVAPLAFFLLLAGVACGGTQTYGSQDDGNQALNALTPDNTPPSSERATASASPEPTSTASASSQPTSTASASPQPTSEGEDSVAQSQDALSQLTDTSNPQVATQPPTMSGAQGGTLDSFIQAVAADVDAFWAQTFQSWSSAAREQYDANTYESAAPPIVFTGSTNTLGCGQATQSLYCPVEGDQSVYIERGEAQQAYEQIGDADGADFAVAYLIAHEYGHHVQAELGYFDPNNPEVAEPFEERSVPFENQADCLAGVWAHYAGYRGILEEDDIAEAMNHAVIIADTRTKWGRSHGTAEERQAWFSQGYTTGDSSQCVGFEFSP